MQLTGKFVSSRRFGLSGTIEITGEVPLSLASVGEGVDCRYKITTGGMEFVGIIHLTATMTKKTKVVTGQTTTSSTSFSVEYVYTAESATTKRLKGVYKIYDPDDCGSLELFES